MILICKKCNKNMKNTMYHTYECPSCSIEVEEEYDD
jgi:predicted RNA-binding Zn-ribbon protein involved in translation (DUF1610 family)